MWVLEVYNLVQTLSGLRPVPRRSCAEDEWPKAEVSRGTAEDYPVLGTPGLQWEDQRLGKGYPQTAPWRGCEWNGALRETGCKIGSRRMRPLRIKCTCQRPGPVNEKRCLDGVTSIFATSRKLEGTVDGMDTEVSTCLTNKWRVRINQEGLYNEKVGAPKKEGKNGQKPEPPSPPPGERFLGRKC